VTTASTHDLMFAGLAANGVDRLDEVVLEDAAEPPGRLGPTTLERLAQAAVDLEHLVEEALEEHGVPGLVGDLRGQEDALVLEGAAWRMGERVSVTACSPMKNSTIVRRTVSR